MKIHDVFQPAKKGDPLKCAYLYEDGHVITRFERTDPTINSNIEYSKIAEDIGIKMNGQGRIVFHDLLLLIMISTLPNVSLRVSNDGGGSEHTNEAGLLIGYLTINSDLGYTCFSCLPDMLTAAWCYQPGDKESFAEIKENLRWSGDPIAKVICKPEKQAS